MPALAPAKPAPAAPKPSAPKAEAPAQAKALAPKPVEAKPAAPVQAKSALPTSRPGDAAERDADARATRVMRSAGPAHGTPTATPQAAAEGPMLSAEHQARLGAGEPLPPDVRALMEPRFGESLADVRLLTDGAAAAAADSIQARAFTLGNRIGFAAGQYQPSTPDGQWLMAHEIAHVLQQQVGSVPRMVMRAGMDDCEDHCANTTPPPRRSEGSRAADRHRMRLQNGTLIDDGPTIRFDSVGVPGFKVAAFNAWANKPFRYTKNYLRGSPAQRDVWRRDVQKDRITQTLQQKASASTGGAEGAAPTGPVAFEVPLAAAPNHTDTRIGRRGPVFFGELPALAEELTVPGWGHGASRPEYQRFHVDHKVELQLAGWTGVAGSLPNQIGNMELLAAEPNQCSGCFIRAGIESKLQRHIAAASWPDGEEPTVRQLKRTHHIEFVSVVQASPDMPAPTEDQRWTRAQIEAADHLAPLERVNPADIGADPSGLSDTVLVFPREFGGRGKSFPLSYQAWQPDHHAWLKPFEITNAQFSPGASAPAGSAFGTWTLTLPEDPNFEGTPAPVTIERIPGVSFAGRVNKQSLLMGLRSLHFKRLCPIEVPDLDIEDGHGLVTEGRVLSTIPLLAEADIRFSLRDGEAELYKTFVADELRLPAPLRLREASLTLFLSSRRGFGAEGRIDFGLQGVGNGFLAAEASTGGGVALAGGFDFDSRYFEPAQVRARYDFETERFTASGDLGFKPDAVPGVRSGTLHAEFVEGVFSATGHIVPAVPGLEEVNLTARHSENQGLQLHGDARVGAIPGVRGGTLAVDLSRPTSESPWSVVAQGELEPAIPGINARLQARYENGVFIASADAPFRVGERISGSLLVGAANVPCDSAGQPQEGATPGEGLFAFGQGTATVQISDQFQGDFGIRVNSDGGVRIDGSFGISRPIPIFEARDFNRVLLPIPTVAIPIFGAAAGDSVAGVAALIGGSINAVANVGPGEIDRGRIGISDFDPARPESLHVTGNVRFRVPANAGVNGRLTASISAGAVVIRADGELAVQLSFGVDASASADLDLDWTQAQGLVLAATLRANASPRLVASITGAAQVLVNAFVTTYTLWRKEYVIAERAFGSSLSVGISVPATWRERGGLDFDINRVQFEIPPITPDGALAALLRDDGSEAATPVEASTPNASFPPTSPNASFISGDDSDLVCR
jgi:Domain of unknown function (DUF4157)